MKANNRLDDDAVQVVHEKYSNYQPTDMEHRFTSTGIKFWRHKDAMISYRQGNGMNVISTHISPEGACNLNCAYCSVSKRTKATRISIDHITDYVVKLKTRGLKAVILTGGGEPTLYPQINELVEWLKFDQKLSVALITNGTKMNRLSDKALNAFSWIRVSINVFPGWEDTIIVPFDKVNPQCVIGCSFVYTTQETASIDEDSYNKALFEKVAKVADKCSAKYIRVLPDCLLNGCSLAKAHATIAKIIGDLNDPRFFHQFKIHGTPAARICHQAYFRPYLSEEPWEDGIPGSVFPCDSLVLNNDNRQFSKRYSLCKPSHILDFLDHKIPMRFCPLEDCKGCVFTGNVNMLDDWYVKGLEKFDSFKEQLLHEEFV